MAKEQGTCRLCQAECQQVTNGRGNQSSIQLRPAGTWTGGVRARDHQRGNEVPQYWTVENGNRCWAATTQRGQHIPSRDVTTREKDHWMVHGVPKEMRQKRECHQTQSETHSPRVYPVSGDWIQQNFLTCCENQNPENVTNAGGHTQLGGRPDGHRGSVPQHHSSRRGSGIHGPNPWAWRQLRVGIKSNKISLWTQTGWTCVEQ